MAVMLQERLREVLQQRNQHRSNADDTSNTTTTTTTTTTTIATINKILWTTTSRTCSFWLMFDVHYHATLPPTLTTLVVLLFGLFVFVVFVLLGCCVFPGDY